MSNIIRITKCKDCPACVYDNDKDMGYCLVYEKTIYDPSKINCTEEIKIVPCINLEK